MEMSHLAVILLDEHPKPSTSTAGCDGFVKVYGPQIRLHSCGRIHEASKELSSVSEQVWTLSVDVLNNSF